MAKAAAKPEEKKPDGKTPEVAEGEEAAPKKKRGKLPLIIGLVVVLAAGGGGAFYFLKGGSGGEKKAEVVEGKHEALKPPVFVPMENFTVNLVSEGSEQYLQVAATLKVLDPHTGDAVKLYMPEIRHRILLWLGTKKPSEINTSAGRERLADELRVVTNNILLVAAGKPQRPMFATAEAKTEEARDATVETEETTENSDKPKEEGAAAEGPAVAKPAAAATPATAAATAPAKPPAALATAATPAAAATPAVAAVAPAKPAEVAQVAKATADDPIQSVLFTSLIVQ